MGRMPAQQAYFMVNVTFQLYDEGEVYVMAIVQIAPPLAS
jgi:hypothetical protein